MLVKCKKIGEMQKKWSQDRLRTNFTNRTTWRPGLRAYQGYPEFLLICTQLMNPFNGLLINILMDVYLKVTFFHWRISRPFWALWCVRFFLRRNLRKKKVRQIFLLRKKVRRIFFWWEVNENIFFWWEQFLNTIIAQYTIKHTAACNVWWASDQYLELNQLSPLPLPWACLVHSVWWPWLVCSVWWPWNCAGLLATVWLPDDYR
jgi:hypothetical protein